jgi:hypothetical protein
MEKTASTNGAAAAPVNGQAMHASTVSLFPPDRLLELIAALEAPFDPADIKWRVTNTVTTGSRNGPVLRGQVLAYADPRAYTDRLNEVFGPAGWTRDYSVQVAQNFERKERGATERMITAKIVVTCKLTIHGCGVHTGLGEEWADNENAGTAAEAQAFKRACSCFGLGRYLYDLEGQWMDLDQHKRPLQTPRLPEWAVPNGHGGGRQSAQRSDNGHPKPGTNGTATNGKGGLYRQEVLDQVKKLCATVGFSLSKSVLRTVANTEHPDKIRDMAKLSDVFARLQDLARGVERLRAAASKAGHARYSELRRDLNLASESIDDIPDRRTLRRLVEALEAETAASPAQNGASDDLATVRGRLLQEAARVSSATNETLAEVIQRASKGALSLATLKSLGAADIETVRTALDEVARLGTLT